MPRKKKLTLEEYRKANNLAKVEIKDENALPDTIEELKPDTSIKSSLFSRKSVTEFVAPTLPNYNENRQPINSEGFARKSKTSFEPVEGDTPKYFSDMQDKDPKEPISFDRKPKEGLVSVNTELKDTTISFERKTKEDLDVNRLKTSNFMRKSIVEIKQENQPDAIEIGEGENGMNLFKNL